MARHSTGSARIVSSSQFAILIVAGSFALSVAAAQSPSLAQPGETHEPTSAMAMGNHLPTTLADWSKGARFYDGLGTFHRPVSTRSPEAQRYFDQGMRFLWGFNHDESTRSFARALELDPSCAMCAWGLALTVGPNYNVPMLAEPRAKVAFEAAVLPITVPYSVPKSCGSRMTSMPFEPA